MFFSKLFSGGLTEPRYIRRTRAYLQEARLAMLEHSIAAEHYQSSAEMYAERARRLEEEIKHWELLRDTERLQKTGQMPVSTPKAGPAKLEAATPLNATGGTPVGIVRAA